MAGGIWQSQNKTIPGVYINVKSQPSVTANIGDKGIVAIAKALSWGPVGEIMEIAPGTDVTPYIGYDISTEQAQFLREMMKGSDVTSGPMKILLWRAEGTGGVAATATNGGLTATAKYVGVRGNDIAVAVIADPDAEGTFIVETIVGGAVVDNQSVTAISGLVNNAWVNFSGSDALSAAAAKAAIVFSG